MKKLPIFLVLIGLLSLVTCALLQWVLLPMFYGEQVVQGMRQFYGPTGAAEHWKKFGFPSPLALDPTLLFVYIFHVTNAMDIITSQGTKPILKEVGPYAYFVEKIIEEEATNKDDNETISFRERKIYHFSPAHSNGLSEEDELTVLNIPFLKAMEQSDNAQRKSKLFQDALLSVHRTSAMETPVFIKRPVKELLFSGFHQPTLEKLHKNMDRNIPPFLHEGKFGFFYPKNGTASKSYKVYSGLTKRRRNRANKRVRGEEFIDFGQIIEYDHKEDLDYWAEVHDNKCNKVSGTPDGMLFAPQAEQGQSLFLFRPDICRSLQFNLSEPLHIEHYGELEGYRYVLPPELLYDSKLHFDNNCFCPGPEVRSHNKSCRSNGTLSNCSDGFPFITSLPHFMDDQGQYLTQTVGLNPNREDHGSFVDLEPITGFALKSSVKLQINYELTHSSAHGDLKNIPESGILFPLLWTNEVKTINFILSGGIVKNIIFPLSMVQIGKWVSLGLGIIFITAGILVALLRTRKKSYPVYFNTLLISKDSLSHSQRNSLVSPRTQRNPKVSFSKTSSPGQSSKKKSQLVKNGSNSNSIYIKERSQSSSSQLKKSRKGASSLTQIDLVEPFLDPLLSGLQRQHSRLSFKSQLGARTSPSSFSLSVPVTARQNSAPVINGSGHLMPTTNVSSDQNNTTATSTGSINHNVDVPKENLDKLPGLNETKL